VQSENHLASALHVQLAEQMVDMQLHGGQAHVESAGNLFVAEPACDQLGDLSFTLGEREFGRVLASLDNAGKGGDAAKQLGYHLARAGLLAGKDGFYNGDEFGLTDRIRYIARDARFGPSDDFVFCLPHPKRDDGGSVRRDFAASADFGVTARERRVEQHRVRHHHRVQRQRAYQIGAEFNTRYRWIGFQHHGESFAHPAHVRHDKDT